MKLGIVYHSSIYKNTDGFYIKELWGKYIEEHFLPFFDNVCILSPLDRLKTFQTHKCNDKLEVVEFSRGSKTIHSILRNLINSFVFLKGCDLVWIFLPTGKGVLLSFLSVLTLKPYIVYIGGSFLYRDETTRIINDIFEFFIVAFSKKCLIRGSHYRKKYQVFSKKIIDAAPAISITKEQIVKPENDCEWPPEKINLLYVGAINENKGSKQLIESVFQLKNRGIKVQLRIAGTGNNISEYIQRVSMLGLENEVNFLGYIENGPQLYDLYKGSHIFILPSFNEGFPRVLIEAVAFGVIPVTTNVGGISDVFINNFNSLIVNPGSSDEITEKIIGLYNDRFLYLRLREGIFQTAQNALQVKAIDQINSILEEICG